MSLLLRALIDICARYARLRAYVCRGGGIEAVEKGIKMRLGRAWLGGLAVGGVRRNMGLGLLNRADLEELGRGRGRSPGKDVISARDRVHASDLSGWSGTGRGRGCEGER